MTTNSKVEQDERRSSDVGRRDYPKEIEISKKRVHDKGNSRDDDKTARNNFKYILLIFSTIFRLGYIFYPGCSKTISTKSQLSFASMIFFVCEKIVQNYFSLVIFSLIFNTLLILGKALFASFHHQL